MTLDEYKAALGKAPKSFAEQMVPSVPPSFYEKARTRANLLVRPAIERAHIPVLGKTGPLAHLYSSTVGSVIPFIKPEVEEATTTGEKMAEIGGGLAGLMPWFAGSKALKAAGWLGKTAEGASWVSRLNAARKATGAVRTAELAGAAKQFVWGARESMTIGALHGMLQPTNQHIGSREDTMARLGAAAQGGATFGAIHNAGILTEAGASKLIKSLGGEYAAAHPSVSHLATRFLSNSALGGAMGAMEAPPGERLKGAAVGAAGFGLAGLPFDVAGIPRIQKQGAPIASSIAPGKGPYRMLPGEPELPGEPIPGPITRGSLMETFKYEHERPLAYQQSFGKPERGVIPRKPIFNKEQDPNVDMSKLVPKTNEEVARQALDAAIKAVQTHVDTPPEGRTIASGKADATAAAQKLEVDKQLGAAKTADEIHRAEFFKEIDDALELGAISKKHGKGLKELYEKLGVDHKSELRKKFLTDRVGTMNDLRMQYIFLMHTETAGRVEKVLKTIGQDGFPKDLDVHTEPFKSDNTLVRLLNEGDTKGAAKRVAEIAAEKKIPLLVDDKNAKWFYRPVETGDADVIKAEQGAEANKIAKEEVAKNAAAVAAAKRAEKEAKAKAEAAVKAARMKEAQDIAKLAQEVLSPEEIQIVDETKLDESEFIDEPLDARKREPSFTDPDWVDYQTDKEAAAVRKERRKNKAVKDKLDKKIALLENAVKVDNKGNMPGIKAVPYTSGDIEMKPYSPKESYARLPDPSDPLVKPESEIERKSKLFSESVKKRNWWGVQDASGKFIHQGTSKEAVAAKAEADLELAETLRKRADMIEKRHISAMHKQEAAEIKLLDVRPYDKTISAEVKIKDEKELREAIKALDRIQQKVPQLIDKDVTPSAGYYGVRAQRQVGGFYNNIQAINSAVENETIAFVYDPRSIVDSARSGGVTWDAPRKRSFEGWKTQPSATIGGSTRESIVDQHIIKVLVPYNATARAKLVAVKLVNGRIQAINDGLDVPLIKLQFINEIDYPKIEAQVDNVNGVSYLEAKKNIQDAMSTSPYKESHSPTEIENRKWRQYTTFLQMAEGAILNKESIKVGDLIKRIIYESESGRTFTGLEAAPGSYNPKVSAAAAEIGMSQKSARYIVNQNPQTILDLWMYTGLPNGEEKKFVLRKNVTLTTPVSPEIFYRTHSTRKLMTSYENARAGMVAANNVKGIQQYKVSAKGFTDKDGKGINLSNIYADNLIEAISQQNFKGYDPDYVPPPNTLEGMALTMKLLSGVGTPESKMLLKALEGIVKRKAQINDIGVIMKLGDPEAGKPGAVVSNFKETFDTLIELRKTMEDIGDSMTLTIYKDLHEPLLERLNQLRTKISGIEVQPMPDLGKLSITYQNELAKIQGEMANLDIIKAIKTQEGKLLVTYVDAEGNTKNAYVSKKGKDGKITFTPASDIEKATRAADNQRRLLESDAELIVRVLDELGEYTEAIKSDDTFTIFKEKLAKEIEDRDAKAEPGSTLIEDVDARADAQEIAKTFKKFSGSVGKEDVIDAPGKEAPSKEVEVEDAQFEDEMYSKKSEEEPKKEEPLKERLFVDNDNKWSTFVEPLVEADIWTPQIDALSNLEKANLEQLTSKHQWNMINQMYRAMHIGEVNAWAVRVRIPEYQNTASEYQKRMMRENMIPFTHDIAEEIYWDNPYDRTPKFSQIYRDRKAKGGALWDVLTPSEKEFMTDLILTFKSIGARRIALGEFSNKLFQDEPEFGSYLHRVVRSPDGKMLGYPTRESMKASHERGRKIDTAEEMRERGLEIENDAGLALADYLLGYSNRLSRDGISQGMTTFKDPKLQMAGMVYINEKTKSRVLDHLDLTRLEFSGKDEGLYTRAPSSFDKASSQGTLQAYVLKDYAPQLEKMIEADVDIFKGPASTLRRIKSLVKGSTYSLGAYPMWGAYTAVSSTSGPVTGLVQMFTERAYGRFKSKDEMMKTAMTFLPNVANAKELMRGTYDDLIQSKSARKDVGKMKIREALRERWNEPAANGVDRVLKIMETLMYDKNSFTNMMFERARWAAVQSWAIESAKIIADNPGIGQHEADMQAARLVSTKMHMPEKGVFGGFWGGIGNMILGARNDQVGVWRQVSGVFAPMARRILPQELKYPGAQVFGHHGMTDRELAILSRNMVWHHANQLMGIAITTALVGYFTGGTMPWQRKDPSKWLYMGTGYRDPATGAEVLLQVPAFKDIRDVAEMFPPVGGRGPVEAIGSYLKNKGDMTGRMMLEIVTGNEFLGNTTQKITDYPRYLTRKTVGTVPLLRLGLSVLSPRAAQDLIDLYPRSQAEHLLDFAGMRSGRGWGGVTAEQQNMYYDMKKEAESTKEAQLAMKGDMDRAFANGDYVELNRLAQEYYADPERGLENYLSEKTNPLKAKAGSIRKANRAKYGY